jgi:glyoxylase-like metal-dependent hydrolase (beta-lactamase superfamily II)
VANRGHPGFASKTEHVGRLRENLKAIDIGPSDIDAILMTHMHPDHEAGLTDADGSPVFRAELVVHENEVEFWRDDGEMGRASSEGRGTFCWPERRSTPTRTESTQ